MKTDPNEPAFSALGDGLTKREYFAALAMQGLASHLPDSDIEHYANEAVLGADALIAKLNEGE